MNTDEQLLGHGWAVARLVENEKWARAALEDIDATVREIDDRVARQLDEILHHQAFQELERMWRGLHWFVDRVGSDDAIRVEILNASKEDLALDFADSPDVARSGLAMSAYMAGELGTWAGSAIAALIVCFEVNVDGTIVVDQTETWSDLALLAYLRSVAAICWMPLVVGAGPTLVPETASAVDDGYRRRVDGPAFEAWRAFRAHADAHFVAVTGAVLSLGITIYFAEKLGESFDLEAAGRIKDVHLFMAKSAVFAYLLPLITGPLTIRNPLWLPWHRRVAYLVLLFTVATAVTGTWMLLLAEPLDA